MSEALISIKHMNETVELHCTDNDMHIMAAGPGPTAGSADTDLPLERLEEQICELAAHLAAGTCQFLQLVAEFDARRGWASWDLPSCAAWLAWKCQVAPGTAREQVRVARALASLPVIKAEFRAGRMSYAKVRALTRIATAETEADLAQICGPMTAAQCERFAAAHRKASDTEDLASRATRRVSVHVTDDGSVTISARLPAADGAVVLQALRAAAGNCEHPHRAHPDSAHGDNTHDDNTRPAGPARDTPPIAADVSAETPADAPGEEDGDLRPGADRAACAASLADALVEVSKAFLSGKIAAAGNPDIYQVIVHVGPEALLPAPGSSQPPAAPATHAAPAQPPAHFAPAGVSAETPDPAGVSAETPGPARTPASAASPASAACRPPGHPAHPQRCHLDDGPAIAPATAQALACHATMSWMLHDHNGKVLDVGRRHRRASPALRRAVHERDNGRCQYPGCNSRRVDIHHITAWASGGRTRLRNLILLCEAHHVIVHALGYLITTLPDGTFTFTRPDGQPMPAAPSLPGSDGDLTACHSADITTDTIIPDGLADKFDLEIAIWAAFANARIDRERQQQRHEHELAA
jgi:5-methylcytosine-specific restriction endonuclease McrA